jgi:hypothetical protein
MSGSDAGAADGNDVASGDGVVPAKPRRPHLKRARAAKAIATTEALSAGGAEAMAELNKVQRSIDQLAQGLQAMIAVQGTHTEMVLRLLAAVTVPAEPEHQVAQWLEQVVGLLNTQGSKLEAISSTLRKLPAEVGSAVAREVASALDKVQ